MKTVREYLADFSSYATLQLLHKRFLHCGECLTGLQARAEEFTPEETAEFGKFKTSRFGENGHFKKYCAFRKAEVLEIPFPHFAGRKKDWVSGLTCTECLLKNHPADKDCEACLKSLGTSLITPSPAASFARQD